MSEEGVGRFIHDVHSPVDDDLSMAYFLLPPMMAARERLCIATPYFVPDRHLKRVLEARALAGVDVRLLLRGRHMDNPTVRLSAQNHYQGSPSRRHNHKMVLPALLSREAPAGSIGLRGGLQQRRPVEDHADAVPDSVFYRLEDKKPLAVSARGVLLDV
jgi:hypothetical protein